MMGGGWNLFAVNAIIIVIKSGRLYAPLKTGRELLGGGGMCFTLPDSILRRKEHVISELEITNGLGDRYEPIIFLFFFFFLFTFTLKILLHCSQCVVRGFQLKAKFPLWHHRRNWNANRTQSRMWPKTNENSSSKFLAFLSLILDFISFFLSFNSQNGLEIAGQIQWLIVVFPAPAS